MFALLFLISIDSLWKNTRNSTKVSKSKHSKNSFWCFMKKIFILHSFQLKQFFDSFIQMYFHVSILTIDILCMTFYDTLGTFWKLQLIFLYRLFWMTNKFRHFLNTDATCIGA
jgi:hypothetical protein